MLPGACGLGVADEDGFPFGEGADAIWDDTVLCPIATTDDIAGTGRSKADMGPRAPCWK